MNPDLPRFTRTAQQGERGVNLVTSVFLEEFGWLFKRNHQEHDFGIDGHVEVVTDNGEMTGQILAAQVKYGKSYFQEKNQIGYVYRGDSKHFNYLANYPIPVLIVICHPDSKRCYWVCFEPSQTQPTSGAWKVTIPFQSDLARDKFSIEKLLPPVKDHRAALNEYWSLNQVLAEASYIHLVIDKPEIVEKNTVRPRVLFDRLCATKELALDCQGKVEISFYGYDEDPRELFEIPEVCAYMPILSDALPELFYFVRTLKSPHTLQAIALCQTKVLWRDGRSTAAVTRHVLYDTPQVARFLSKGYVGLNKIMQWLGLPIEENKRISDEVALCLSFEKPTAP